MRTRTHLVAMLGVLAAALLVAVTVHADLGENQPPPQTPADAITYTQAHDALIEAAGLVARPGSMAGYDRDRLFPDWADLDGDGCDTREEVLMRDATEYTSGASGRCVGTMHLEDPYGQGPIESIGNIQIDHVVPLAVAWRSGGRGWTPAQWETFANDEANLLAVDGGENQSKGDKTPDVWMPPQGFQCGYSKVYVTVVVHYNLSLTQSTWDALRDALEACPR
jgi:hypothetical protein